jgi:hypothetical protein
MLAKLRREQADDDVAIARLGYVDAHDRRVRTLRRSVSSAPWVSGEHLAALARTPALGRLALVGVAEIEANG